MHKNSVLGVIPAKGYSQRVPRKNIRELCGKPLISYTIEAARKSCVIDRLVVSTDDESIVAEARKNGAEVPFIRSEELASDGAGVVQVVADVVNRLAAEGDEYANVVILLPTSPFRTAEQIRDALTLFSSHSDIPVLMSVIPSEYPPYWALEKTSDPVGCRLFPDCAEKRRQELPETYRHDGSILIISSDYLLLHESYNAEKIIFFDSDPTYAVDIDTEQDFLFAEFLMSRKKGS